MKTTAAGNQVLDAVATGHHSDIAIATALALFASNDAPQALEAGLLEGWY